MSEEKKSVIEAINKTPLRSKKFIAAMIWNLLWLMLIGYGIHRNIDPGVLQSMVWACATSCGLYLGGQSFVDSMVRSGAIKIPSFRSTNDEK